MIARRPDARMMVTRIVTAAFVAAGSLVAAPTSALALDRTVSVSGQCLRTALPDRGSINLVPDFQDKDIKVATRKATESYETIKKQVQALKLKNLEIQTSEYSVNEQFDYVKGKSVSRGYRARMGLLVTTSETARLGEVIAIAAKNDVKDVGALSTFLSEEKSRDEREACLEEAIQHAGAKASRMAKAAGARLGKVVTLVEEGGGGGGFPPPPKPMRAMMMKSMADEAPAPIVDSAAQKIQLSVNAVYILE
jgi:uncharacterized protein YggE